MATSPLAQALIVQAWLSPGFPTGAFSYSHGLEFAVEAGLVHDAQSLRVWIDAILRFGSARNDGMILLTAHRAASATVGKTRRARAGVEGGEGNELFSIVEIAAAMRPTSEMALESTQQGGSFLATVRAAWPHPHLDEIIATLGASARELPLAIAVGIAAGVHELAAELVLPAFLQAFAANIVNAGARLIPLGQTDCQRVIAALQTALPSLVEDICTAEPEDFGSCVPVVDWCSMTHETQYTRLFRS
jgi:urease accessory protein